MQIRFCEGSLFDTVLMEVSFFQAGRHEDFTGSVDKVWGEGFASLFGQILNGDTGFESKPSASPWPNPSSVLSMFKSSSDEL